MTASQRPQDLFFKTRPDNSVELPFVPKIRVKPHALKPLPAELLLAQQDPRKFFAEGGAGHEFENVYREEILAVPPPTLQRLEALCSDVPRQSEFLYVDTEEKLLDMIGRLAEAKLLTLDTEHHSEQSFLGFTCLLQVSVHGFDYVVDALLLRERLFLLQGVLANPAVLKVAHGSKSDVEWLQKDFGLHVVNLLDTYFVAKKLQVSSFSLSSLV